MGRLAEVPDPDVPASPDVPRTPMPGDFSEPIDPAVEGPAAWTETGFLGEPDTALRAQIRTGSIATVERGGGGRSLGFKIVLDTGVKGYFKPEQTFSAAHWYSEVAAYYLDRMLGFGRTPPLVGRSFDWAQLREAAKGDRRIAEVRPRPDGSVRGAFSYWVPGGLHPIPLGGSWERIVRFDGGLVRTPYDRPDNVARGAQVVLPMRDLPPSRAAELSDLLIFDYLVQNVDRWGGDFTNVRSRGVSGPLVFLDNAAGFWPGQARLPLMESRLKPLQRVRRVTYEALRRFDLEAYRAALDTDPLAPILTERQLEGLAERVRAVLEHVDSQHARFGDALWLP